MKQIFIPVKFDMEIDEREINSLKLPKSIVITYSIQYAETALKIKKILSKSHKITAFSQILGCSKPNFPKDTKAILLIGSGRFHAISLALETSLPIYILEGNNFSKISEKEVSELKKKRFASYMKFLNSEKVGIIVSTKPGQENLERAIKLRKVLSGKKSYIFLSNEINTREFENFKIDSWINSACPRLDFDSPVANISDLNLGKFKDAL